jgi:hypothetical protein
MNAMAMKHETRSCSLVEERSDEIKRSDLVVELYGIVNCNTVCCKTLWYTAQTLINE